MTRKTTQAGFTLVEILLVVVMISLLTVLAYPTLKTFSARNADTDVASKVANTINKVRDQARRRNRAYSMTIQDIDGATPQGRMVIREGDSDSCRRTFADLNSNSTEIERIPYGTSTEDAFVGDVVFEVGISGWVVPGGNIGNPARSPFVLCASPDGALHRVNNRVPVPVAGRYRVLVQRYLEGFDGWKREGPPRTVELTFGGGARLGVN